MLSSPIGDSANHAIDFCYPYCTVQDGSPSPAEDSPAHTAWGNFAARFRTDRSPSPVGDSAAYAKRYIALRS